MSFNTISPNNNATYFDLTQSQFLIWTGQQLSPLSPMYNMAFAFELQGSIEEVTFNKAFLQLVSQSDAMRTVIEFVGDRPRQKIVHDFSYELEILDFSNKENKKHFLKNWIDNQSQKIFDLSKRLFDSALIKMGENRYVWFLKQHHLITDGWSKTIQYNVLSEYYQALLLQKDMDNFTIPRFENYIKEESAKRLNQNPQIKSYWQELANRLPSSDALYGKNNQNRDTHSERVIIKLTKEKVDQIRKLTQEPDIRAWTMDLSLFNIFGTLLFALMSKLSGQEEMTFGTPVHNRSNVSFRNTPGLFIELFPLSVSVKNKDSFSTLFNRVQESSFNFLKHAQTGASSVSLIKSFNTVLNYINVGFGDFNGTSVVSDWIDTGHADPGHYLKLQIFDFDKTGEINLCFDLNTSVFNESKRSEIPKLYASILDDFIADRFQKIHKISSQDLDSIAQFNNTAVNYPKDKTIVDLFEEQVKNTPQKVALVFEGKRMDFQTLNEKANQVAHYLLNKNIQKENLVAICLDRSFEMMIGLLGILKSGAAYVPIDPEYPQLRIDFMIEDIAADYVITTNSYANIFKENNKVETICFDGDQLEIRKHRTTNPALGLSPENLMYVIYTSGSTGRPKGVMNQHSGVVNRLLWAQDYFQLNSERDVVLQKTTFCFDVSVWELFWPLITGVKLVIARPQGHKDSAYLKKIIEEEQVTTMHFVPSMLEVFLMDLEEKHCSSLEKVLCSGEALKTNHVNTFRKKMPETSLFNLYGPTEAAIDVTCWKVPLKSRVLEKVLIGKPIANTKVYIIDDDGEMQNVGLPGELCISGIQVARAYHDRPELNNEKFLKDPFEKSKDTKLYKTGDLARWMPDGNIEFLGRIDNQVKIRGHRIELGEIENILSQNQFIIQSLVIAQVDANDNNQLIAYVILEEGYSVKNIKKYLQQKLPQYMIPSRIKPIQNFPLTSNGKVDREALSNMDFNMDFSTKEIIEASNEIEEMISEIWSEVLQIKKLGIHQNFLDLGGDSLSGIRVMIRINETFDLELPVNSIFIKTTIEQLAVYIEETIKALLIEMDQSNLESI